MTDRKLGKRNWREVAKELCNETDSTKVVELCEELTKAIDEERKQRQNTESS
jgi:hypothetical protein